MILKLVKFILIIKLIPLVGAVVGGFLAAFADELGVATGVLAASHPSTWIAWTAIGTMITIVMILVVKGVFGR
ncbi:hypothetical protein OB955_04770 [Halobacteria archaeon AArc-m2/3/4]|uniref:Transglycosylase associated protein n=1 Tax=Natronoglomus mannanivorans TaxID=2979990 RepID=A0ABT2QAT9_9EURY|nr:hypothetical protein [Halobacteria archaeon AArc-m2/3/4]